MLNRLSLNRIGLNRIGLNRIGSPSRGSSSGTDRPYIDPKVLDSLCGVWIADQNTNESESRNIIKNKIADKGGDLELLNFAYKLNSGYNGYSEDFTAYNIYNNGKVSNTSDIIKITYVKTNSLLISKNSASNSYKIKVSNIVGKLEYYYIDVSTGNVSILALTEGVNSLPACSKSNGNYNGFMVSDFKGDCNITIEQLPLYEGALVTDGKDDMIVSQKTAQEMLGGSNECTVLSMIRQLSLPNLNNYNNTIRNQRGTTGSYNKVEISAIDKTGIYGYSFNSSLKCSIINDILGDKQDYSVPPATQIENISAKYFVQGWIDTDGLVRELSSVAWYWTIIANKVLTTDQINQVISYFNLDKHVKPDIIYDTIRQGITNENHASFNDELVDFSGNGHNMKLYNLNWDKQSGIGSYPFSFKDYNYFSDRASVSVNKSDFVLTANFDGNNFLEINTKNTEVPSFKIKAEGIDTITNGRLAYRIAASDGSISIKYISEDGEYEIPGSPLTENAAHSGFYVSGGINDNVRVKVTIIPDYEGALVSDGIDDYGKVENLPIYKDYTVVADREMLGATNGGVFLKGEDFREGAFSFDYTNESSSFGGSVQKLVDTKRLISYQSKYVNNGININAGTATDTDKLWLAKLGNSNRYSKLALWSFLLFPYSLSEFLLERQLKKYKLGTLYPDMVEWRPQVNINVLVVTPPTFSINNGSDIITNGQYIPEGTEITIRIFTATDSSVSGINEVTAKINGVDIELTPSGNKTYYGGKFIISSKQKIDITIDEYIRFEDIVQPYPYVVTLSKDNRDYTWGDKIKVGDTITCRDWYNLYPTLYAAGKILYNGNTIHKGEEFVITKESVFSNVGWWGMKNNVPHAIYSPQKLNIPNSSLKILGYVPDLTGKGNHGKLNNFAYTEDSGVAADGSIKFDGTDDHITIPTLAYGGKCVMMKVNWNKDGLMLYDQRKDGNPNSFAIYIPNFNNENSIAYSSRNDGKTYIDGVLNTSVKGSQLKDVTHNITIINSNSNNDNTVSPAIGSNAKYNAFYAQMSLYEFMLFPEIPSEDEIKKLNDVMGIEGNTDDLFNETN